MSIEALAIVFDHSRAEPAAKLVLIALAAKSMPGPGDSRCPLDVLSAFAGLDVTGVRQAIGSLVALGELGVSEINDESVHYDVLGACPPTCDGSTHLTRRGGRAPGVRG